MKTKIFKSYEDFFKREDKNVNGVSVDFASEHPDFEEDNKTNTGCWNCYNCLNCTSCESCESCEYCYLSDACKSCKNCSSCYNSDHCYNCDLCSSCSYCSSCYGYYSATNRKN